MYTIRAYECGILCKVEVTKTKKQTERMSKKLLSQYGKVTVSHGWFGGESDYLLWKEEADV